MVNLTPGPSLTIARSLNKVRLVTLRVVLALFLIGAIVSLTPLAQASPPDPSWIKGVYDDDDFDNVVISVTSAVSAVELAPLLGLAPTEVVLGFVTPAGEGQTFLASAAVFQVRAPPSASAFEGSV